MGLNPIYPIALKIAVGVFYLVFLATGEFVPFTYGAEASCTRIMMGNWVVYGLLWSTSLPFILTVLNRHDEAKLLKICEVVRCILIAEITAILFSGPVTDGGCMLDWSHTVHIILQLVLYIVASAADSTADAGLSSAPPTYDKLNEIPTDPKSESKDEAPRCPCWPSVSATRIGLFLCLLAGACNFLDLARAGGVGRVIMETPPPADDVAFWNMHKWLLICVLEALLYVAFAVRHGSEKDIRVLLMWVVAGCVTLEHMVYRGSLTIRRSLAPGLGESLSRALVFGEGGHGGFLVSGCALALVPIPFLLLSALKRKSYRKSV